MNTLDLVGERQGVWSATASQLKTRYERARLITFILSISGALLATIASQLPEGRTRLYIAVLSAVLFAIISFLAARMLDGQHAIAWVRARAASEALKQEAYRYASGVKPYDDAYTRDKILSDEREKIETDVDDLIGLVVPGNGNSIPTKPISPKEYIERRVGKQIDGYFEPKAAQYQRRAKMFRHIEFGLALITTCITAIVGVAGKSLAGVDFDFVALTAVLTTISGTILAHIEAARYDFLVTHYRATARRLRNALVDAPEHMEAASPEFSVFVERCEAILSEENNTWLAKWSKPAG